MSEDKTGKDHLRESKRHLEKSTQKFLKAGERRLEYYSQNRSQLIADFSRRLGDPKEPAVAGTIVLLPLVVTLLVVNWLFGKIAAIPGNQYFNISPLFGINGLFGFYIDQTFKLAILLIISAIIVTGVGRFVRTESGFQLEKSLDELFSQIPFLSSVYNITKVTTETVLGGAEDLSEPVKVDLNGLRVTGFKTGNKSEDGRTIVFIPTSPNITTGMVVELDDEKIIETGEKSEKALTRVLSAGFGNAEGSLEEETEDDS